MIEAFAGSTGHSLFFFLVDSSTGLGKTGIAYTAVTGSYSRSRAARVAITMSALTAITDAFSAGGWFEVDGTTQPGLYRLDATDAAFAAGAEEVVVSVKATGCKTEHRGFRLVAWNKDVASIPNAVAGANAGLPILSSSGTTLAYTVSTLTNYTGNTPQTGDAYAVVNSSTFGNAKLVRSTTPGNTLDVSATGEAGIDWANVGSPTTTVNLTNTSISTLQQIASVSGAVASVTGNVGGNVTGSVGSVVAAVTVGTINANVITATAIAANALTAAKIATDAIGAAQLAADAVTEIQTGLSTLTAAGVRTAVGLAAANLDTQLSAINAKTTNLPADPADASDITGLFGALTTIVNAVPAAVGDIIIEGTTTLVMSIRGLNSAAMGLATGLDTGLPRYRDLGDTKDRIAATTDADGNRSVVVRDLS